MISLTFLLNDDAWMQIHLQMCLTTDPRGQLWSQYGVLVVTRVCSGLH